MRVYCGLLTWVLLGVAAQWLAASDDELTHVDVFVSGTEGYHTFRIPSVARTADGTLHNGYAFASRSGLREISRRLETRASGDRERLRGLLRIGVQWNTQVTLDDCAHLVSQAYCSAMPVAYSGWPSELWEDFARLILEAAYEAVLCVAIQNWLSTGNRRVFLTLLGGGAFGNRTEWIIESIARALRLYEDWGLDVAIVSYGKSKACVRELTDLFRPP